MEYGNVELDLEASRVGGFPRLRLGHEPGGQSWETGQSLMLFSILSPHCFRSKQVCTAPKEWSPSFPQPFS